ncbi:Integral membrane protein OS=Streptomyces tendae OX=1932 GN=GUR47_14625 PE=4 SV=1 [Streptomyces tendae]
MMALPMACNMAQADGLAVPAGVVLGVVAVAALVLLVNPTTQALGIRGPGSAGK